MFRIIIMAVIAFVLVLPANQSQAQNMRLGGFDSLRGAVQYCDLRPGGHSRALRAKAKAYGAQLYRARDLHITLVHMRPMSARNKHATAVFRGQRVPVCAPHPDEAVWAVRKNGIIIPLVMHSCGNEVVTYATASRRKARDFYRRIDGEPDPGGGRGNAQGHGETGAQGRGNAQGHGASGADADADAGGGRGEVDGGTPAE